MLRLARIAPFVLIVLIMVSFPVAGGEISPNLIPNHDFEMGVDQDDVPTHWQVFSRSAVAYFELTTEHVSSGSTALVLTDTVDHQSAGLRSALIPAQAGRTYQAQIDALVERGLAQFYLDFHDAGGQRIVAQTDRARVDPDWQTVTFEATAPEGTAFVSLILYSDIVNIGKAYFDNVRLFDVTPEPAPEQVATERIYARPGTRLSADQYISLLDITVAQWEERPSAFYTPLPVSPGPDAISTGPLHVQFSPSGLPVRLNFDRLRRGHLSPETQLFSDVNISVTADNNGHQEVRDLVHVADESGYEVNNSYFTRRLARFTDDTETEKRLDVYTELITDSIFFYMFPRLYIEPNETLSMTTSFHLDGTFRRVTYFEGDTRAQRDLTSTITLHLDDLVTKPFILLEKSGNSPGIAFFLPVRPEVRAWYHEHYVAASVPTIEVTLEPTENGLNVTFDVEGLTTTSDRPHTFDFYYWAFPMQAAPALSLHVFQGGIAPRIWSSVPTFSDPDVPGFWVEHMSNVGESRMFQALRYYPFEGYSFAKPDHFYQGLFTSMPDTAHVWGNQTANYKRLNFTGAMDQAGLLYDIAVRHLQLYLDKSDDVGIPPFRANAATWFRFFEGLSNYDLLGNFHFAQAPEFMVKTALNFIATGKPSDDDALQIASVVNRMMDLLDPNTTDRVSTTFVLPDGSYWYNYFEMETQRIQEGLDDEPGLVNNVHLTWLNVIADAAKLNKRLGNDEAYEAWLEYFRKGIDGMIYIFQQERAWANTDPNELLYGISWPGPNANYAQYILSGWLPNVMEFAYEDVDAYRLVELTELLRKIMKGRWTTQATYTGSRVSATNWLNTYLYPRDTTAPITRVMIDGTDLRDGASVPKGAPISISATDDLSGVSRVEYAVNGGDWLEYHEPLTHLAGDILLHVRATDFAGNVDETAIQLQFE